MLKRRSSHFQSERGSKKFEDLGRGGGSGFKIFRTGMGYNLGGGLLLLGGSVRHYINTM